MFDGNKAGREITSRAAKKLSRLYKPRCLKECALPEGYDPKNLAREQLESLVFG
jgi:DNA primase